MIGRRPLAPGDVVLVQFPFTDLSGSKLRPALIAGRPAGDDLILAFITTRVTAVDPRTTCPLGPGDAEFQMIGLKAPSAIRLERLATLHRSLVQRRLGSIGQQTRQAIARCLRHVFDL